MKLQMWLEFVPITCLDGKVKWTCKFFIQYWMDPWMEENLIIFATSHSCFGNWSPIMFSFIIPWWLKRMCHLWNHNICLIINLCLIDYWYIVCLLILTIQIIIFLLNIFELWFIYKYYIWWFFNHILYI
jgi:hypothetical protein